MRQVLVGMAMAAAVALAPGLATADDQEIAQQIVERLQQKRDDGQLAGFDIELEVDDGTVLVSGRVSNQSQHDLLLDVARRVPGVKQVVNDLQIEQPQAERTGLRLAPSNLLERFRPGRSEESVEETAAVAPPERAARHEDTGLRTASQIETADASIPIAPANVPVSRTPAREDGSIAQEVIGKLRRERDLGNLRDFTVDVNVDNGTVWLSGRVATAEQQNLVLESARYVRGVHQVVNDLSVAPSSTTSQAGASMPLASAPSAGTQPVPAQPVAAQPVATQPVPRSQTPVAFAPAGFHQPAVGGQQPVPQMMGAGGGMARVRYDHPNMPGYAWPSYAAHPNYAGVTYPRQYSPTAWPYIGPFYPYPQVPLGWRNVTLRWHDGWWFLDFKNK